MRGKVLEDADENEVNYEIIINEDDFERLRVWTKGLRRLLRAYVWATRVRPYLPEEIDDNYGDVRFTKLIIIAAKFYKLAHDEVKILLEWIPTNPIYDSDLRRAIYRIANLLSALPKFFWQPRDIDVVYFDIRERIEKLYYELCEWYLLTRQALNYMVSKSTRRFMNKMFYKYLRQSGYLRRLRWIKLRCAGVALFVESFSIEGFAEKLTKCYYFVRKKRREPFTPHIWW